tara:strand:- start:10 stop:252 length:243 start_codon:yes stop_codon:yes gene_type:complete
VARVLGPIRGTGIQRFSSLRLCLAACQTRPNANAENMRVDGNRWFAKGEPQHDIGTFPADPRQFHQGSTISRHKAVMSIQ